MVLIVFLFSAVVAFGQATQAGPAAKAGATANFGVTNLIPDIGQSLCLGGFSGPPLPTPSATVLGPARMWNGGVKYPTSTTSIIPLVEGTTETPWTGFAQQINAFVPDNSQASIHQAFCLSGTAYALMKKGTATYNDNVAAAAAAAALAGKLYIPAINLVHGEADAGSPTYAADIETWRTDYTSDFSAITGQTGQIPMFLSQVAGDNADWVNGPLQAYFNNPTLNVMCTPKYHLPYLSGGTHLTAISYRTLGEIYAKCYYKRVVLGSYTPVYITSAVLSGTTITVQLTGMVGDLVNDCTYTAGDLGSTTFASVPSAAANTNKTITVTDTPYAGADLSGGGAVSTKYRSSGQQWYPVVTDPGNLGFAFTQGTGTPPTITNAVITDATSGVITLTLSGAANCSGICRVTYAQRAPGVAGPATGARGCIHDSYSTLGVDGMPMFGWLVHQVKVTT